MRIVWHRAHCHDTCDVCRTRHKWPFQKIVLWAISADTTSDILASANQNEGFEMIRHVFLQVRASWTWTLAHFLWDFTCIIFIAPAQNWISLYALYDTFMTSVISDQLIAQIFSPKFIYAILLHERPSVLHNWHTQLPADSGEKENKLNKVSRQL